MLAASVLPPVATHARHTATCCAARIVLLVQTRRRRPDAWQSVYTKGVRHSNLLRAEVQLIKGNRLAVGLCFNDPTVDVLVSTGRGELEGKAVAVRYGAAFALSQAELLGLQCSLWRTYSPSPLAVLVDSRPCPAYRPNTSLVVNAVERLLLRRRL